MVEIAVYGLIGALATAFVFLLALPAISARANRLAARRSALSAPLNAAEAQARLDGERAKRAVDVALADRRAADAQQAEALAKIEVGRRDVELSQTRAHFAAVVAGRNAAIAEIEAHLAETRAELRQREADIRERDAEIGAREIALFGYEGQRDAAARRLEEAIARMRAQQVEAEAARADQERRFAALAQEFGDFKRESERRLAAADDLLAQTRRKLSASEAEGQRLQQELEDQDAALAQSARREAATATRLDALNAARQEAEASLRGARADRDARLRETEAARAALEAAQARLSTVVEGDESLRREIARLGRALVAAPEASPAPRPADPLPLPSPFLERR